jgi:hypothetical protein
VEREIRRTIRTVGSKLVRVTKWGNAWYAGTDLVCTVYAFRHHVGIEFWRGATLAPAHPMLEGTGKNLRHAKLRSVSEANSRAFRALVRAAIRLDTAMPRRPR